MKNHKHARTHTHIYIHTYIQGDSGENINILGGESISLYEKNFLRTISNSERLLGYSYLNLKF